MPDAPATPEASLKVTPEHRKVLECAHRMVSRGGAPPRWIARETALPLNPKVYQLIGDLETAKLVSRVKGHAVLLTQAGQTWLEQHPVG